MFIKAAYLFLEHLKIIKNASEHTIRNYSIDLNALKVYLEQENLKEAQEEKKAEKISYKDSYKVRNTEHDYLLDVEVNRKTIRGFLAHLNYLNESKKTIVRRLSSLRTFFKFAFAQGFYSENPTEDIENLKTEKKLPSPLSYEQIQRLFAQPDLDSYLGFRDRTIMELFYSSGLRISELVAVNRQDIDIENLLIKLKGKGKKERIVPITKNAADWIDKYLNNPVRYVDEDRHCAQIDEKAVFLNKWGKRLTTRSIDRHFDKYLKASGLAGKATPHTIRHTIATHWLANGMDLKTIQAMLGHSSLSTTTIYTQVSISHKKKVYDQAHPRA